MCFCLGAAVTEMALSPLQEDWHACEFLISIVARAAADEEWAHTRFRDFSERVRRRVQLGELVSGLDYVQVVQRWRELQAELQVAGRSAEDRRIPEMEFCSKSPMSPTRGLPAVCVCPGSGRAAFGQRADRRQARSRIRWSCVGDAFEKAMDLRSKRPDLVA